MVPVAERLVSPLDVHVNRSPVDGTITRIQHFAGKFRAAWEDKASLDNERNAVVLRAGDRRYLMVQIAGALARLLVPGRQDISIAMTIVLGIVGSFVGGFLGYLIFHKDAQDGFFQPAGIIGSIIGAIIVLLIWVTLQKRRTTAA